MSRFVAALAALLIANASAAQPAFPVALPAPDAVAGRRVVMESLDAAVLPGDQLQPAIASDLLFVEPLGSAEVVRDAPYSADAVTESIQTLADGNRIVRRSSVQLARDGRGRERREHQAMVVGPMVAQRAVALVTITDPAAGTAVTVDHVRQVATRMRMRRWASPSITAMRLPDDAGVAVAPLRGTVAAVGGETMSWTMAASDDVGLAMPAVAATLGGEPQTVTLEAQTIEGVRVEGTRTTTTIAAAAIGNELPIEIVTERWFSPELKTVVLSRRSDPRFGETVFRLTNLIRAEPAAELFEIPAGYRVDEPKVPPLPR